MTYDKDEHGNIEPIYERDDSNDESTEQIVELDIVELSEYLAFQIGYPKEEILNLILEHLEKR